MSYLMMKFDINDLHTVIWFQVFLSNTNNFQTFKQVLPLQVRVHLKAMVTKAYSILCSSLMDAV